MEFTDTENVPALTIFIEFQKAFDSVEWDFILGFLEAFNFGPDLIQWIKTFYRNAQSCAINNGTTSDVRQGDPLSIYFCFGSRSSGIAVRQDATIKGVSVGEETKLLQYADDLTAVLADVSSAQALFDLLEIFKKASDLTINFTKTEDMWIGSSKDNKSSSSSSSLAHNELTIYITKYIAS